jgi:microcystin-dependent protein
LRSSRAAVGLPDLRARVAAGVKTGDTNFGTLGQQSGEASHVLTLAELPTHWASDGVAYTVPQGSFYGVTNRLSVGTNTPHNNVQPTIALTPLIKT